MIIALRCVHYKCKIVYGRQCEVLYTWKIGYAHAVLPAEPSFPTRCLCARYVRRSAVPTLQCGHAVEPERAMTSGGHIIVIQPRKMDQSARVALSVQEGLNAKLRDARIQTG